MRDILLTLSALLLMLCLVGCISAPSTDGEDTTAQAEIKTEQTTHAITETDTAEQTTAPVTDTPTDTAEEQTTFGELHFPESGE